MQVQFLNGEDPLEEDMATHSSILAWQAIQSTGSQRVRNTTERLNTQQHRDLKQMSPWQGLGEGGGEGNGTPLQYFCLENPVDGGAWQAAVHGVARSRRRLSDFAFTFHFHALEKEMATHSGVLAWRIPGTGEPGVLPSMGSHRVGHD